MEWRLPPRRVEAVPESKAVTLVNAFRISVVFPYVLRLNKTQYLAISTHAKDTLAMFVVKLTAN